MPNALTRQPRLLPEPDEPVSKFVRRRFRDSRVLFMSAASLRTYGLFFEVQAEQHTDEMEEWCYLNAGEDMYYYTFGDVNPNIWFFNDESIAALFKLAYGKN
jgi:hypothetical protein